MRKSLRFSFKKLQRIKSYTEVLRLTPFEDSTEQGRSRERYRLIALSSSSSLFAKSVTALLGLVTIPLTVNYFGKEQFGLWMVVSSVVLWLQLADFGISNGLKNALAEANGRNDKLAAQGYVSTSFVLMSVIALGFLIFVVMAAFCLPWGTLLKLRNQQLTILTQQCILIAGIIFIINIPLSVVSKIFIAYQLGYIPNLFQIFASLISLFAILIAINLHLGLKAFVFIISFNTVITNTGMFIILYKKMPWCRLRLKMVAKKAWDRVAHSSIPLFWYQICSLLITYLVNIVIARQGSLEMVADYNIIFRIYLLIFMIGVGFAVPFYPAIREAHEKRELSWIRSSIRKALLARLTTVILLTCPMILAGDYIISLWIKQNLSSYFGITGWLSFLLCIVMFSLFSTLSEIMIWVDDINPQTYALLVATMFSLTGYYLLIPLFGVKGVFIANVIGIIVPTCYVFTRLKQKHLRRETFT